MKFVRGGGTGVVTQGQPKEISYGVYYRSPRKYSEGF